MEFKIEASSQTKVLLGRIAKSLEKIAENLKLGSAPASALTIVPKETETETKTPVDEPKKMTAKEKKALEKKIKGYADEARLKLRELAKRFGHPKAKAFLDTQFKVGSVGELVEKPDAAEQLQELANACDRLLADKEKSEEKTSEDEDWLE